MFSAATSAPASASAARIRAQAAGDRVAGDSAQDSAHAASPRGASDSARSPGRGDLLNTVPSRNIFRPGREIHIRYVTALLPPPRPGQHSLTRPIPRETLFGPPLDQVVARLLGRTGRAADEVAVMPAPPAWDAFGATALVCARPGEPDWPLAFLDGLTAAELDAALALAAVGRTPVWAEAH